MNNQKMKRRRIIVAVSCGLLIVISLITFQQQISISDVIAKSPNSNMEWNKIYDKEWISTVSHAVDLIPQNETLAAIGSYPQVIYFSDHKVIDAWPISERSLVQFMWRNNCSYLLFSEPLFPKPNFIPFVIQMAEKPFDIISDYYNEYISKLQSDDTPLLDASESNQDNTRLSIERSHREGIFQRLFEKIFDHNTPSYLFQLYHLRSNITRDNLNIVNIVTDKTPPLLSVSLPINGTIMESDFGVLRLNVTGTAIDADGGKVKKVEVSIDRSPFKLADPRAPDDWSMWSFSDIVTSEGTKRIMVRATNYIDKKIDVPVDIKVK
jgi:hypothetical protein